MSDPCSVATKAYTDYYEANKTGTCNLDNNSDQSARAEYCSTCIPKYDSLLSEAVKACGANIDQFVKLNHDYVKYAKAFYCTTDSATGEYCDAVYIRGFNYKIPYSQWDATVCKSSCVAQIDAGIREVASNQQFCTNYNIDGSLFTGSGNPVSACGGGAGAAAAGATGAATGAGAAAGATGATGTAANGIGGATTGTGATNPLMGNSTLSAKPTLKANATSDGTTLNAQICLLSLIICLIMALLK